MNELVQLRKITMLFEEIYHDGGPPPPRALVRAAILAIARNPYAGRHVDDMLPYVEALQPLGLDLAKRLIDALGGEASLIEAYGQGAIVGTAGETEHAAAWFVPGNFAMQESLPDASAHVPSTSKVGIPGTRLDVPIGHVRAAASRSHLDGMEVGVADAPRPDEIVFVLAMSTGGRIHARIRGPESAGLEDGPR